MQEQKQRAEALAARRKQEEKERWWAGVDLFARKQASKLSVDEIESENHNVGVNQRYDNSYARWDSWVPQDPATLQEVTPLWILRLLEFDFMSMQAEAARLEEEAKQNSAFEKSNPDFCKEFLSDQAEREKQIKKKETSADALRLRGNRHFQRKEFELALNCYMEALKLLPYDVKTLTNIAQVRDVKSALLLCLKCMSQYFTIFHQCRFILRPLASKMH